MKGKELKKGRIYSQICAASFTDTQINVGAHQSHPTDDKTQRMLSFHSLYQSMPSIPWIYRFLPVSSLCLQPSINQNNSIRTKLFISEPIRATPHLSSAPANPIKNLDSQSACAVFRGCICDLSWRYIDLYIRALCVVFQGCLFSPILLCRI